MSIANPPLQYSQADQAQMRAEIEREDKRNQKKGADIVFSGDATVKAPRLIGISPDGTRYRVLVDNAGAISTVAV